MVRICQSVDRCPSPVSGSAKVVLPPYLVDTAETREVRCRYYTDVTWMDRQVGEVLAALQAEGLGIVDVSTREADLEDVFLNLPRATGTDG